jgi:hypothetical protein
MTHSWFEVVTGADIRRRRARRTLHTAPPWTFTALDRTWERWGCRRQRRCRATADPADLRRGDSISEKPFETAPRTVCPLALNPQRKTDRTERRPGSPLVPTVRRFWIGVGVPRIRATSSSTQMDQQRRQSQSQRTWTTVLPIIPAVQARGRVSLHDDPEPERDEGRGFEVAIAVVRQNSLLLKLHQSAQSTRSDLRAE